MLLNEQTAVQLGDKKVVGVRQGDKFILGRHNLVPNGQGRYTSGTVEIWRNLHIDPEARNLSWVGWSSWAGVTPNANTRDFRTDVEWSKCNSAVRLTWTNADDPTSGDYACRVGYYLLQQGVTAGTVVTVAWKTVVGRTGMVSTAPGPNDGANSFTIVKQSRGSNITLTAGQIYTDWCTFVLPDNYASLTRVLCSIQNYQAGDWIEMSEGDCYIGSYNPNRKWFDGSYSPDPDLTPSWTGTANASASVLSGVVMPGLPTLPNIFAVQSTKWPDGGASVRLIPRNDANDSYVSVNGDTSGMRLGMVAGRPTAVRARGYLPSPQTGALSSNGFRNVTLWKRTSGASGYTSTKGTQPPNVQGEFISELVTTLPTDTTEAFVRLYNGASVRNGEVYWTDVIVAQANTEEEALRLVQAPYRDGDSPGWTWDGTPGKSASRGLS